MRNTANRWDFVSRETEEALEAFVRLVLKWTPKINLISRNTVNSIWDRHIADSLELWPHIPKQAETLADLGSGGGLPVIPLAIIAKTERPDLKFHAVESDQRKAAFLRKVSIDLDLKLTIHAERIEKSSPLSACVVTARALSPLVDLLPLCARHMDKDGIALLPKGASHQMELRQALECWSFSVQTYPSHTDSNAVILKIESIQSAQVQKSP